MLRPQDLDKLPDGLVELYSRAEQSILSDMAARIAAFDDFIPAAQWQYRKLIEMGNSREYVVKTLAALMGKTEAEVKHIMEQSGAEALESDDEIYRAAGLSPHPLSASQRLQEILSAGLESTMGLFENLTRTTANTAAQQLERALDRAWLQVSSGAFSHQEATRIAVKELAAAGIESIRYPSGHVDKLDVVVRRALLTGVNQTALKLQEARAEEMGCDLVEVTAHSGARVGIGVADHAGWQGKVYSRKGTHSKYPPLVEKTGYGTGPGLGGWNCRHSMFPFIEGVSEPAYTESELEEMNAPKYEYNGQKMTEYEATQRQRYIERQIRRWKREKGAMKAAGLDTAESAAKLKKWQDTQRDFLRQTGLKRQYDRERVEPVRAAAAADAARNTGKETYFDEKADYSISLKGYPEKVNAGLSEAIKDAAKSGSADRLEHLNLVDLGTGRTVVRETGESGAVGYDFWGHLERHPEGKFAFVHNHNTDGWLSEQDLTTLLTTPGIAVMIAVRNDGIIYVAPKDLGAQISKLPRQIYQDDIAELSRLNREGELDVSFKRASELKMVENLLRDYVRGYFEKDGRN